MRKKIEVAMKKFCAVSASLNRYQSYVDEDEAFSASCEAKVAELLERDDYAATDAFNIASVLYEMSEAGDSRFQEALEAGDYIYAISSVLMPAVEAWVKEEAERDAEAQVKASGDDDYYYDTDKVKYIAGKLVDDYWT